MVSNFIENSSFYIYKLRSCKSCIQLTECTAHKNKDWSFPWLDCGRCGCEKYIGEYTHEIKLTNRFKDEKKKIIDTQRDT